MTNFMDGIMEDPTTRWFLYVLAALFLFFMWALILRSQRLTLRRVSAVSIAPTLLATIGVIGTFTGIFVGLRGFDVNDIQASVPTLLEGLKTAFITSLVGMGLSVLYRIISIGLPPASGGTGASVFEELRNAMLKMVEGQREGLVQTEKAFQALQRAIAGDEDDALTCQIKLLRTEAQDGFKALAKSQTNSHEKSDVLATKHHEAQTTAFDAFAKHMVENTHKALIEALESVIQDFNEKLTEQFGENFKQLNEAVGELVTWQDKYRVHVETMEKRIEASVDAMNRSAEALERVDSSASHIPKAIEPLQPLLQCLDSSLSALNADLEALGDLRERAKDAFPLINANLEAITNNFSVAVETMEEKNARVLEQHCRTHATLEKGYEQLRAQAVEQHSQFRSEMTKIVKTTQEEFERAAGNSHQAMDLVWQDVRQKLGNQVTKLDEQLGNELEKALKSMSANLGGMSQRFVDDYGPLTEQLAKIVRIAQSANSRLQ